MMNMVNPNDLLASRVIDIARHNRGGDAFIKGESLLGMINPVAVGAFGKFPEDQILSLHARILAHEALASHRDIGSNGDFKVEGMEHGDSDILAADAPRKGGLRQSGAPKFKAPAGSRSSVFGLDKLAAEKRAQAAGIKMEPPSKRVKVEADDGENASGGVFKVPAIPVKREAVRVKPEETPSHGGGLSEAARKKLEERRAARNKPSTAVAAAQDRKDDNRGLGDFKSRLNRGSYQEEERRRGAYGDRERGGKSWDAAPTPRTGRSDRDGDGSLRVPNRRWDDTPSRGPGGWGKGESSRRGWDETPSRGSRGTSPDLQVDAKEWEEEQVRLDRDWYTYDDEGAVVSTLARNLR